jgi:ribose-phosphate pyrophosphokinase
MASGEWPKANTVNNGHIRYSPFAIRHSPLRIPWDCRENLRDKAAIHVASPVSGLYQDPAFVCAQESGMAGNNGAIKLVAGNSNPVLAQGIGTYIGTPLTKAVVRRFADMEIFVEIQENVRGADVFVIQSTSYPANDHMMELLIIIDALRRASAQRITAVIPYFGYARQDRKPGPRTPISAKLVANLITRAGVDRVLTLDLHAGQIQGFFDIPTDNLFAAPVMVRDVKQRFDLADVIVVSPDVGGVVRARGIAKRINAPLAIVDKRRERPGESEVANVIGEVDGHICVLVDDIVDSAGTLLNAADALLEKGAKAVYAYITHGVLSGGAVARINKSNLKELVITDSIQPTEAVTASPNIRVLPIAALIGEAISRTAAEQSVSSLFFD